MWAVAPVNVLLRTCLPGRRTPLLTVMSVGYCWLMDALFSRELPLPTDTCGFSGGSAIKNLSANAGDVRDSGLIPGLGRSARGGHSNSLQSPCLENLIDRGALSVEWQKIRQDWSDLSCMHSSLGWPMANDWLIWGHKMSIPCLENEQNCGAIRVQCFRRFLSEARLSHAHLGLAPFLSLSFFPHFLTTVSWKYYS